jgi:hypothetical protein
MIGSISAKAQRFLAWLYRRHEKRERERFIAGLRKHLAESELERLQAQHEAYLDECERSFWYHAGKELFGKKGTE